MANYDTKMIPMHIHRVPAFLQVKTDNSVDSYVNIIEITSLIYEIFDKLTRKSLHGF